MQLERSASMVRRVLLAPLVLRARVRPELRAQPGRRVYQEPLELPGQLGRRVRLVRPGRREAREQPEQAVRPVLEERLVGRGLLELRVRAPRALLECRARLEPAAVTPERPVRRVPLGRQEIRAQALRGQRVSVLQEPQAQLVRMVSMGRRVLRARPALRATRALRVRRARLVRQVFKELQARPVPRARLARQEPRVRRALPGRRVTRAPPALLVRMALMVR